MSIEPHIAPQPSPIEPELSELGELDMLFNAYFEGDLPREEREAFERRLESDDPFRSQYNEFVGIMGGLRALPFEFAPDDFVERVESRIRTRSAGRLFADTHNDPYQTRVPYEMIAIVMIVVMAAAYLMMEAPKDRGLNTGDVTLDRRLK